MGVSLVVATVLTAEDTCRSVVKSLFNVSPETPSYVMWYFFPSLPMFIIDVEGYLYPKSKAAG